MLYLSSTHHVPWGMFPQFPVASTGFQFEWQIQKSPIASPGLLSQLLVWLFHLCLHCGQWGDTSYIYV